MHIIVEVWLTNKITFYHQGSSSNCLAVDGPGSGLPCKFPFKYYGKVHNSCTDMMKKYTNNKPWCSTKVDETGKHMRGNWGNCDESCLSSPNGNESV